MRDGMAFWEEGLGDVDTSMGRENDCTERLRVLIASGELDQVTGILIVTVTEGVRGFTWRSTGLTPDQRELLAARLARHLGG